MTGLADLSDAALTAHLARCEPAALQQAYAELQKYDDRPDPSLLTAALWYATTLNWPVFPLAPGGKKPRFDEINGFTAGFKSATRDPNRIRAAWTAKPDANIGVPTGQAGCGYDVVDVDGPTGYATWAAGLRDQMEPMIRARAVTPRGLHLYVKARGSSNGAAVQPGIDLRGNGGYVAVPPSIGAGHRRYAWTVRPTP